MVTNTSASQTEQPVQTRSWELIPLGTKSTRTFVTPTGHKVLVQTIEGIDYSYVSVQVTDDNAFVNMGCAYFTGCNHQQECEDYLAQHMSCPALEHVCRHFGVLCSPFGDEDVA